MAGSCWDGRFLFPAVDVGGLRQLRNLLAKRLLQRLCFPFVLVVHLQRIEVRVTDLANISQLELAGILAGLRAQDVDSALGVESSNNVIFTDLVCDQCRHTDWRMVMLTNRPG